MGKWLVDIFLLIKTWAWNLSAMIFPNIRRAVEWWNNNKISAMIGCGNFNPGRSHVIILIQPEINLRYHYEYFFYSRFKI